MLVITVRAGIAIIQIDGLVALDGMPGLRVQDGPPLVVGVGEVGTVTFPVVGFVFFVLFRHIARPHPMTKAARVCSVLSVLFMNISLVITQLPFDWVSFAEIKELPMLSIYIGMLLERCR